MTVVLARFAAAQPDAALSVSRGPGADDCPDAEGMRARVARIRGATRAATLPLYHVTFTRDAAGLRATIASGEGTRTLEDGAGDCAALADATAVTLALLFDARAAVAHRRASPQPSAPERAPAPAPAPALVSERSSALPPAHAASVGVAAGVVSGLVAPLAPIGALELGLHDTRLRLIVAGMLTPATAHALAPGRVHQALTAAALYACVAPFNNGALRLDLCAAGALAFVHARAEGFDANDAATRTLPALGFALRFGHMPTPLGAELAAELLVPLRRQDFAIDEVGVAYESAPLALLLTLRMSLGASW